MELQIVSSWCQKLGLARYENDQSLINVMFEEITELDCNNNNPLRIAIESKDIFLIERIVRSILHVCHLNKQKIIQIVVQAHCPLLICISYHYLNLDAVGLLIKYDIDVNKTYVGNTTALHYVAERGYIEQANILLKAGANINVKNSDGKTPIHVAMSSSFSDKYKIIKVFIENGADINTIDCNKHTLLYTAINNNYNSDIVDALLNKGAKYNLGSIECKTLKCKHSPLQHLLHCEIDLNKVDDFGNTILHRAVSDGNKNFVTILIQNGSKIDAVNNDNLTPLHYALRSNNLGEKLLREKLQIYIFLLKYGADTTIKDKSGLTAWDTFLQKSYAYFQADGKLTSDVMSYFDLGCDLNEKKDDETFLQCLHGMSIFYKNKSILSDSILRQIIKLKSLNLSIDENNHRVILEDPYHTYYNMNLYKELVKMKTDPVYGNITVYDILTVDHKILSHYVKNEELVENFNKKNLREEYFNYGRDIINRFQIAYQKQKVTENAMNFMYDIFCFDLTEDMIEKIVHHMSLAHKFDLYDHKYLYE